MAAKKKTQKDGGNAVLGLALLGGAGLGAFWLLSGSKAKSEDEPQELTGVDPFASGGLLGGTGLLPGDYPQQGGYQPSPVVPMFDSIAGGIEDTPQMMRTEEIYYPYYPVDSNRDNYLGGTDVSDTGITEAVNAAVGLAGTAAVAGGAYAATKAASSAGAKLAGKAAATTGARAAAATVGSVGAKAVSRVIPVVGAAVTGAEVGNLIGSAARDYTYQTGAYDAVGGVIANIGSAITGKDYNYVPYNQLSPSEQANPSAYMYQQSGTISAARAADMGITILNAGGKPANAATPDNTAKQQSSGGRGTVSSGIPSRGSGIPTTSSTAKPTISGTVSSGTPARGSGTPTTSSTGNTRSSVGGGGGLSSVASAVSSFLGGLFK